MKNIIPFNRHFLSSPYYIAEPMGLGAGDMPVHVVRGQSLWITASFSAPGTGTETEKEALNICRMNE